VTGPVLHLSATPYPSPQGTQALIREMLEAAHGRGGRHELFSYAHGDDGPRGSFPLHRLAGGPRVVSLRSGPSLGKALLDLRMVQATRRLARRLGARALVAHNVEAALIGRASGVRPLIYLAHTRFEDELPSYASARLCLPLSLAGRAMDALAAGRAARVVTVAPELTRRLRALRPDAETLLPPWPRAPAATPAQRAAARTALGLPPDADVLLYAGNLDAYQGWQDAVGVVSRLARSRPRTRLLVATASDPEPLWRLARVSGQGHRLTLTTLASEDARRRAYAAADLALVPRRVAGGVPIKLLDALGRQTPVVTTPRASAGLTLRGACLLADDDDVRSMTHAAGRLLADRELGRRLTTSGSLYLEAKHAPHLFAEALEHLIASLFHPLPTGR